MLYTYVMSDSLLSAATPLAPADFLTRSASVHGDRIAVEASGATLTYSELARRAAQAAGLFAELGLEPGGRVSVLAPNSLTSLGELE
jgi:acyl-CoA synthetase (AMP-forming)/AMP-acid ligase II